MLVQKEYLNRLFLYNPQKDYNHSCWSVGENPHEIFPFSIINGKSWQTRRKHVQDCFFKVLTNDNLGKILKLSIENELEPYLLNDIIKENKIWYPRQIFDYLTFNIIYHTMLGFPIARNNKLYKDLNANLQQLLKYGLIDIMSCKIPFFKYLWGYERKLDEIRNFRNDTILRLIRQRLEQSTAAKSVNIEDGTKTKSGKSFIDYTHELVVNGELTQDQEVADTYVMFAAGTETTSNTLDFGMALTAKNMDIQERVRNELLNVMKDGFDLKLVHNVPLFRAFVYEILRISSVVFMGVNRISYEDKWIDVEDDDGVIRKYKIPKNTMIQTNVDYIHIYNGDGKEKWKNVDGDRIFLENWLSEDGRFVMNDSFILFGVGRRDCVGRGLAVKEIEYVMGYLLMNYRFKLDMDNVDIVKHRKEAYLTMFVEPKIGIRVERI